MNKKENQRVMLTKRLLKDALIRLLNGKSIDEISVTELCRESGINRSTFYHHYGSPYDVLAEREQTMLFHLCKNDIRTAIVVVEC
ncbi:MAG: TetR/AcrR family transcriptional regulator, partial [Oscillospiraceae bacterium]|nr:TetR/AcrR family transcriptional regulator [Oscillospiraceae bacterium]